MCNLIPFPQPLPSTSPAAWATSTKPTSASSPPRSPLPTASAPECRRTLPIPSADLATATIRTRSMDLHIPLKSDSHHNRSAATTRRRDIHPADGATFLQRPHPCAYETPDTVDTATADKKPAKLFTAKV